MGVSYSINLRYEHQLSGELILSGGVKELIVPRDMKPSKAIVHAYIGSARQRVKSLRRLIDSIRQPVPKRIISNFLAPRAAMITLGFFFAKTGYDEREHFPDADIVNAVGEHIVETGVPALHFGEVGYDDPSLKDPEAYVVNIEPLKIAGIYEEIYRTGKINVPEAVCPEGSWLNPLYWAARLSYASFAHDWNSLHAEAEKAEKDKNLEKLIMLGLKRNELAKRIRMD